MSPDSPSVRLSPFMQLRPETNARAASWIVGITSLRSPPRSIHDTY